VEHPPDSQERHVLHGTVSFTVCFVAWGLISARTFAGSFISQQHQRLPSRSAGVQTTCRTRVYLRRGSDFTYSTTSLCSSAVRPRLKQES